MSGLKFMGKDPAGNAKAISVNDKGKLQFAELPGVLSQELRPGKNLFNKDTVIAGYLISSDGELSPSAGWTTSDFIPVKSNSDITVNKMRYLAEYDENKQFIKRIDSGGSALIEAIVTTAENTAYIRVTVTVNVLDILQVEYGTVSTSYEPYHTELYIGGKKYHEVYADPVYYPLPDLVNYKLLTEREKFKVWEYAGSGYKIAALHNDVVVIQNGNEFRISNTGLKGEFSEPIILNSENFPNLIAGSGIEAIYIIPYTRNMGSSQTGRNWRVVVITNKCQIYHNFPSRATTSDGTAQAGDEYRFDESVVWDLPERKHPSADPSATGVEMYFPCLPDECYEYHPGINIDNGYGNGGFGKSKTVGDTTYPRFYFPKRNSLQNSFAVMGGYEPGDKLTLVGTYRSNYNAGEGCRMCIFATDDGGRQWYCKYEFASAISSRNWVNDINTSTLSTGYVTDSFKFSTKKPIAPSASTKEPADLFEMAVKTGVIQNISREEVAVVTTATPHGLNTGNVIVIQANGTPVAQPDWDWMRNDTASTTSGGNGICFKVEKVTDTTFKLHEHVHSAFNNLQCRHIHHINRIKDGYIIGTGEVYPDGWLLYAQVKGADSFEVAKATDELPIYRLNSTNTSVQRTLGVLMLDDVNSTIIAASDSAGIARKNLTLPTDRTDEISRNSIGIFKGKLADIDDISNFDCICEVTQPAYFFKEKLGAWIFSGQRGEGAISFDKGGTWELFTTGNSMQYFFGVSDKFVVMRDNVIELS